jgi:hypothetical protein
MLSTSGSSSGTGHTGGTLGRWTSDKGTVLELVLTAVKDEEPVAVVGRGFCGAGVEGAEGPPVSAERIAYTPRRTASRSSPVTDAAGVAEALAGLLSDFFTGTVVTRPQSLHVVFFGKPFDPL